MSFDSRPYNPIPPRAGSSLTAKTAFLNCRSPRCRKATDKALTTNKAHAAINNPQAVSSLKHVALPSLGKTMLPKAGEVTSNFRFAATAAQFASANGRPRIIVITTKGVRNTRSADKVAV
jgi:hypothetical protein